jgi:uncharacterized protein
MDIIEQLKEDVKYILEEGEGCHDWDHTLRVYNLAMYIGKIENADLKILGIAALLHDIGRPVEMKSRQLAADGQPPTEKICHAEIGAIMAEGILQSYEFPQEKIEKVKHCILTHRFTNGHEPQSLEAKILYDADKIDNIGAIGILRAANYSGTYKAKVHNPEVNHENVEAYSKEDTAFQYYHVKLKKIKNKLFTDEARRIAKSRHKFMEDFFERVNAECRGEC